MGKTCTNFSNHHQDTLLTQKQLDAYIQDGYVVYRDGSHISVEAALALKRKLEAALKDKGLFS